VSVDHWLQVVSPKSGEQVGEIMCLLAFGVDDQVTQLEQKRGLRKADISLSLPVEQVGIFLLFPTKYLHI